MKLLFITILMWVHACADDRHNPGAYSGSISLDTAAGHASWTVTNGNKSIYIPATVPGGIYSDLMANNVIGDILYRFNDVSTRWVAYDTWNYTGVFYVNDEQHVKTSANLVFLGLDTFAQINLNGHYVGYAENMFNRHIYPVAKYLQSGHNELTIAFASPIAVAKKLSTQYFVAPGCVPDEYNGECHANQIRKMQASFSWDWGPAFPSVGIWKSVSLEFTNDPVIRDVTTHLSEHSDSTWRLNVSVYIDNPSLISNGGQLEVELIAEKGVIMKAVRSIDSSESESVRKSIIMNIPKNTVKLWWPNGYGNQTLYDLRVAYRGSSYSEIGSRRSLRIGFRTIELIEEDIALHLNHSGLSFHFKVNGYPIFMKGSNWIPGHILPELGYNPEYVDKALEAAKETHMNMLRVWGGGVYESDYFYSKCDELGILIWQDFMFACAMYPANNSFLNSVSEEVKQNVIRLQHHPSIALWAGNNENEVALRGNWYATESQFGRYKQEYIKLYVTTMRPIVNHYDPERQYMVSSPSNGIESEREGFIAANPYDSHYGDTHYYNYISDGWSMATYPETRFASEYGFQGLPSLATMKSATNVSKDFEFDSEYFRHRQHSPSGYAAIELMFLRHLHLERTDPQYVDKFIYYSQISQAMVYKAETEFYRQSQADWFTMGALYWQLNDVWQAPSWSSIEYGGRWKMVQYFAKQFFAPILVSPRLLATNDITVYIINDDFTPITHANVVVDKFTYSSLIPIKSQTFNGNAKALSAQKQNFMISIENTETEDFFYRFSLISQDNKALSPYNYIFPKSFKDVTNIKEPHIQITVKKNNNNKHQGGAKDQEFNIHINVDNVVLFLWLEVENITGHFENNGFIVTEAHLEVKFVSKDYISAEKLRNAIKFKYYSNTAAVIDVVQIV